MTVHSLHVFDRKGKVLFTKRYVKDGSSITSPSDPQQKQQPDDDQLKLVFGMIYSLREVAASLSGGGGGGGSGGGGGLHSVKTGASTLYNYETSSGMRFALYVTGDNQSSTHAAHSTSIRQALAHVYHSLWIQSVNRSPLYRPTHPNVSATNFEHSVDAYLGNQPWFR
jgi:trafficking protein particle complex subunit 1